MAGEIDTSMVRWSVLEHFPRVPTATEVFLKWRGLSDDIFPQAGSTNFDPADFSDVRAPSDTSDAGSLLGCGSGEASQEGTAPSLGTSYVDAGEAAATTPTATEGQRRRPLSEDAVALLLQRLPIKDLFRFGHVLSDDWFTIWQKVPLVCHDIQFATEDVRRYIVNYADVKFYASHPISSVIDMHPGPIEMFRLDLCTWRGGNFMLTLWIHKLIQKQTKELYLAGRWPPREGRLDTLPNNVMELKNLRGLYLSFLSAPLLVPYDNEPVFPYLTDLHIAYCVFSKSHLDNLVRNCNSLTHLSIGYVTMEILTINSKSLQSVRLWKTKVDYFSVSCPRLTSFHQEAEFSLDTTHRSRMQFRGNRMLHELCYIQLDRQYLELSGYVIKSAMDEFPVCESLQVLGLVVDFSSKDQLEMIPSLLKCFTNLRADSYEGVYMNWDSMLSDIDCIRATLRFFELSNCKSENVERSLGDALKALAGSPSEFSVEYLYAPED